MIIYDGPSSLNGKPILGILIEHSKNTKTGDMAQLYILPKRVSPIKASKSGYDAAVCGDCPLRHYSGGACYVNLGHGPRAVWESYRRGKYESNPELYPDPSFQSRSVRLGAYGDPAALPYDVVRGVADMFSGHTGYTHQWRTCDQRFSGLLMASADSESDKKEASAMGWRTFRVVTDYVNLGPNEKVCANDSHGVECGDCLACHGKGGRADIAIKVHGPRRKRFGG